MFKEFILKTLIPVLLSAAGVTACVQGVLSTTGGSSFAARQAILRKTDSRSVTVGSSHGSLAGNLILRDVELEGREGAPFHHIRIGEIRVRNFSIWRPSLTDIALISISGANAAWGDFTVEKISGTARAGFALQEGEALKIPALPENAAIRIQRIEWSLPASLGNLQLVRNGRVILPRSDPVLFYGRGVENALDFGVYGKRIDLGDFKNVGVITGRWRALKGFAEELDARVEGPPERPEIRGSVRLADISSHPARFMAVPIRFELSIPTGSPRLSVFGKIEALGGRIRTYGADIEVESGLVIFNGDPLTATFDFKGSSRIEGVLIRIRLKGTVDRPELELWSEVTRDQEALLMMLFTGKSWKGVGSALREGRLSADVAKEFLDYFSGGSGRKLENRLGISDFSIRYDGDARGFEVKRPMGQKVKLLYGMEQPKTKGDAGALPGTSSQKLGAEYALSENSVMAVEGQKEFSAPKAGTAEKSEAKKESVLLKYKSEF